MVQRWHHRGDIVFQTGGLVYDTLILKSSVIRRILSMLTSVSLRYFKAE